MCQYLNFKLNKKINNKEIVLQDLKTINKK